MGRRSLINKAVSVRIFDPSAGQVIPAAGNTAAASGEVIPNPGATPTGYIFQAILLTAKISGVFRIGWCFPFNSDTTGDVIAVAVSSVGWTKAAWPPIAGTGKITLAAATAIGAVGSNVGGAVNGGSVPGVYKTTNGGTPIAPTVTGAGPVTTTVASASYGTLTGLLAAQGMQCNAGSARIFNGTAPPVPFAIGSPVLVEFIITANHVITMQGTGSFWAEEVPVA